jgi:hypothetical protein
MTTQHWSELITRPKKKSVRRGHVIIEIMPPTIARHSEKEDDQRR